MIHQRDARSSMIHRLRLQNYKCFEDQSLEFKALTLLSGLNGTGKSSVLQSLLLLRQSYQQNLLKTTGLALNGDLIHIGTAKDALFESAKEDMIGFDLALSDGTTKGYGVSTRTFQCHDGIVRTFRWHVRLTPGAWRLYFYPLPEERKLIIGYIGPHPRTVHFSH